MDEDPFADLVARARAGEAAGARARERWLRRQAEEGATLAGTLVDLAEAGTPVALRTTGGRWHRGTVAGVGPDVVAVRTGTATALVPLVAVAVVQPATGARFSGDAAPAGDRRPAGACLADLLAAAAAERPVVAAWPVGGDGPVRGELVAVGADVVTIATDGPRPCYVPLSSLAEVVLFRSG